MKFRSLMGALAVLAASSLAAHADDAVSLRLNWYFGGLHVPFYYGKEKGFYKAEGIDLTINEGRGSVNTVQVVAAGSDTFGLADSSSVIAAAAKGAEVKSVMSVLNSTGYSVLADCNSGTAAPIATSLPTRATSRRWCRGWRIPGRWSRRGRSRSFA